MFTRVLYSRCTLVLLLPCRRASHPSTVCSRQSSSRGSDEIGLDRSWVLTGTYPSPTYTTLHHIHIHYTHFCSGLQTELTKNFIIVLVLYFEIGSVFFLRIYIYLFILKVQHYLMVQTVYNIPVILNDHVMSSTFSLSSFDDTVNFRY